VGEFDTNGDWEYRENNVKVIAGKWTLKMRWMKLA
jgi:hypothetical protein